MWMLVYKKELKKKKKTTFTSGVASCDIKNLALIKTHVFNKLSF